MKEKLAVLKSRKRPMATNIFRGSSPMAAPEVAAPTDITLDVDEFSRPDIDRLRRDPEVMSIAPLMPMHLVKPVEMPEQSAQETGSITWGVTAVGANTSPFDGSGVTVAILDTGIDPVHPAFAGVELTRKNFTGGGEDDSHGHGTHCAGTVFGRDVDGVRIGVAPGITRAIIGKVLGQNGGSSDSILNAILWAAEKGANIISMSLGMDFPGYVNQLIGDGLPVELATSRALEGYRANIQLFDRLAAVIKARAEFSQTTVIIAAAGNESRRHIDPNFEIAVSPPATSEGIISVAAIGKEAGGMNVADFSNTGADISGPGVDVRSAALGGGLTSKNGTSMATPHVAGVAALWAQKLNAGGQIRPLELVSRVVSSGTREEMVANIDPFDIGAGMVRAPQA